MVDAERRDEFERVASAVQTWAAATPDVVGVLLVGSWARGEARMDSDADVVVLTTDPGPLLDGIEWAEAAIGQPIQLVRTEDWGALIERRVRLASGFEIEFGVVAPSWADGDPLDPGTGRVVGDGCRIWHDPSGLLARLVAAVGSD